MRILVKISACNYNGEMTYPHSSCKNGKLARVLL